MQTQVRDDVLKTKGLLIALRAHVDTARAKHELEAESFLQVRVMIHGSNAAGRLSEHRWFASQDVVAEGRVVHHWGRRIARLAANLGSGTPPPPYKAATELLPLLVELMEEDDTEVLQHVLVPLAEMSAGSRERIRAVVQAGDLVVPRLVGLLKHPVAHQPVAALPCCSRLKPSMLEIEQDSVDLDKTWHQFTRRQLADG